MKKGKVFMMMLATLMIVPSGVVMAQKSIEVTINNQPVAVKEKQSFIDDNNRALVPLDLISEKLGARVEWNASSGVGLIFKNGKKIVLKDQETTLFVNGKEVPIDTKVVMKDGYLFIPIKYMGELLKAQIKWLPEKNTVAITQWLTDDEVVARVNDFTITAGEMITQMDYEILTAQYQYQYDDSFFDTEEVKTYVKQRKDELLDYQIMNKVALIKGKELKLEPTLLEIEEAFNQTQEGYETEAAFVKALAENKLTPERYKEQIKQNLTLSNVNRFISNQIVVTEDEIKAYYESNKEAYRREAGANMAHILVETEEEAKTIKAAYNKGVSFEELALKYGTDETKNSGGNLGYIAYDSKYYDEDFLKGARNLQEGEVSNPVQTQFGWHLIKVSGIHKESYLTPLAEVKEDLRNRIMYDKSGEAIWQQLEEWGKSMSIEKNNDAIDKL